MSKRKSCPVDHTERILTCLICRRAGLGDTARQASDPSGALTDTGEVKVRTAS